MCEKDQTIGTQARTFLIDALRPEVDFLHSESVVLPKFSGRSSIQW